MSIKKLSSQNAKNDFGFLDSGSLHHAYVLSGAVFATAEKLQSALFERDPNGECVLFSHETFSKEDALYLRDKAVLRAHSGVSRYLIIFAEAWTREAQNALLKLLEEPGAETHFFLLVASEAVVLPTIRSRSQVILLKKEEQRAVLPLAEAEKFLADTRGERLAFIANFLKEYEVYETSGPRRRAANDFLSALEVVLAEKETLKNREALATILTAKSYLTNQGALVKMILENVALQV